MRASSAAGRADLSVMTRQLSDPATAAELDPRLLARLRQLAVTYPPSFTREEAMAASLDQVVRLLRDPQSVAAVEPEIDAHLETFALHDADRVQDIRRRTEISTAP
jgi:hypothetical protein